jgi:integrase
LVDVLTPHVIVFSVAVRYPSAIAGEPVDQWDKLTDVPQRKDREAFIRVCTKASIPWSARGKRGLRLHDLRAPASTLLVEDGASAREVMALLGHKSPQMFLHYTKVEEQAQAKTAARMDTILSAS